jgi:hypothetical protein
MTTRTKQPVYVHAPEKPIVEQLRARIDYLTALQKKSRRKYQSDHLQARIIGIEDALDLLDGKNPDADYEDDDEEDE